MGWLLTFSFSCLLSFTSFICTGLLLVQLWGWFVTPIFGIVLTFWQIIGLRVTYFISTFSINSAWRDIKKNANPEETDEDYITDQIKKDSCWLLAVGGIWCISWGYNWCLINNVTFWGLI